MSFVRRLFNKIAGPFTPVSTLVVGVAVGVAATYAFSALCPTCPVTPGNCKCGSGCKENAQNSKQSQTANYSDIMTASDGSKSVSLEEY